MGGELTNIPFLDFGILGLVFDHSQTPSSASVEGLLERVPFEERTEVLQSIVVRQEVNVAWRGPITDQSGG
jgi:hypothetical protein